VLQNFAKIYTFASSGNYDGTPFETDLPKNLTLISKADLNFLLILIFIIV
jgi:hypothetical protein